MPARSLRSLIAAMRGQPSETEAIKVIDAFAAIPAAIAGIFVGAAFVPTAASAGGLLTYAAAGAIGAATATLLAIHVAYWSLGFRAVSCVAGAVAGTIIGSALLFVLAWRVPGPHWAWLGWLPPSALGAIIGAFAGGACGAFTSGNRASAPGAADDAGTGPGAAVERAGD